MTTVTLTPTYPVVPSNDQNGARLRLYRTADHSQVRALFVSALSDGPGAARQFALENHLFKPTTCLAYIIFSIGIVLLWTFKQRLLGGILSLGAAAYFLQSRWDTSRWYYKFFRMSLQDDLADITTHYKMQPSSATSDDLVPSGASAFWVVEVDKPDGSGREIVGCVGLDCCSDKTSGELRRIVISSSHQKRGYGKLLMETVIARAKAYHLDSVSLHTSQYQLPAMQIYKKYGFKEVSRRDEPYGLVIVQTIAYTTDLDLAGPAPAVGQ